MKKIIRVVGCIFHHKDEVLILHRSEKETDPSLWGIPAGKVEKDEEDSEAIIREIFEETGLSIASNELRFLGQLDIEYETITVQFPIFYKKFNELPDIILDPREHIGYRWMTPRDILELPDLMLDVDKIIEDFCIGKLHI
jgi:8-oxo-dGTP diphosphatase